MRSPTDLRYIILTREVMLYENLTAYSNQVISLLKNFTSPPRLHIYALLSQCKIMFTSLMSSYAPLDNFCCITKYLSSPCI